MERYLTGLPLEAIWRSEKLSACLHVWVNSHQVIIRIISSNPPLCGVSAQRQQSCTQTVCVCAITMSSNQAPVFSKHTQEEEVAEQETLARRGSGSMPVYVLVVWTAFFRQHGNSSGTETRSVMFVQRQSQTPEIKGKDGEKLEFKEMFKSYNNNANNTQNKRKGEKNDKKKKMQKEIDRSSPSIHFYPLPSLNA